MSKFIIYNTNKSQVFPEDEEHNQKSDDIDTYIDNAIEYYINNRKNRIIALVRADAPQVEGRDKANFYVEFNSDTSKSLTKELANRLDQHSSNTEWNFHTNEPRWATPWFVAESEVDDPADLEFSTPSILTVQDLIQDGRALDFGFSGYEDAATVLSYFTGQENAQASYAIASNGRKRVIQSAELVLQPGRHDNFELLSEDTRDQIAQRHDELKSDAKLSYQDETIEFINSIQDAPELNPIQVLDDLHDLDTFISNNNNVSVSDLELYSYSASNAITRINAVKNRRCINDAPPIHFLDTDQREKIIKDVQNLIREQKSELEQNLVDKVLSSLDNLLMELEREPPGSVINEVSEIEEQLANGQPRADRPHPGNNAIGHILELISHIKTSESLDQNKKENLCQIASDRLSEFKSGLREQQKKKIEDEINACVNSFPSKDNDNTYHILNNIGEITENIENLSNISCLSDTVRRHEKNINKTINRISGDQIIRTGDKKELQTLFTKRIKEYKSKIKINKKKSVKKKIDRNLKSLETKLTTEKEYQIYSTTSINYIFSEYPIEHQELNEFEQIYDEIKNENIFCEDDISEMKILLKNKLNDRRSEIVEKEKEDLLEEAKRYREDVIRKVDGEESIPLQVEKISKIRNYLRGKIDKERLPDEVRRPYLRNLRILSERSTHGILNSKQIAKIRDELEESTNKRIKELNEEYKDHILSQLENNISRLDTELGDEYELKIENMKKLRSHIDTESDNYIRKSNFMNLDPDHRQTVYHIIELINKSKRPNTVLSQEDRNQIRESIVDDLDEYISRAQDSLLHEQKTKFEEYLTENYSVNNAKEAHQLIEDLQQIKLHIQRGATAYSVPDTAVEQLNLINSNKLDSSHKQEFNSHFDSEIESLIEKLRRRVRSNLKTRIFDYLETIAGSDQGYDTKMKKMQAVSDLVDPSSSANESVLDQALISSVDLVKVNKLESIFTDVNSEAQRLINEELEEHSEDIYHQVVRICENSSSPDQILNSFSEYLNSDEETSTDTINNDKLRKVCKEYSYVKKLSDSGVISEDQFNSYKSMVESKAKQLNEEFGSENMVDRLRDNLF